LLVAVAVAVVVVLEVAREAIGHRLAVNHLVVVRLLNQFCFSL
jgi:hypothetical protein